MRQMPHSLVQQFRDMLVEQCVVDVAAVSTAHHEAGVAQQSQVVGHGGLSRPQLFAELGDGARAGAQHAQDAQAHGLGESLHDLCKSLGLRYGQHARRLAQGLMCHGHYCACRTR